MLNSFRLNALVKSRHPSHQPALERAVGLLILMLLISVAVWFLPKFDQIRSHQWMSTYVHSALEMPAIAIACMIFAIGWTTERSQHSRKLMVFSSLFLGVAVLDFSHMMSYQGMPHFVTPADAEKAIWFWLGARTLAAAALLWAALGPRQRLKGKVNRYAVMAAILLLVTAFHVAVLVYQHLLPRTYLSATGLTPFKIGYELALIVVYVIAAAALWRAMGTRGPSNLPALLGAVGAMILSGICFAFYSNVHDYVTLLGHVLKIISYLFLFKAIFIDTVDQPYREMEASRSRLQAIFDALPDILIETDSDGRVIEFHSSRDAQLPNSTPMLGRDLAGILPAAALSTCARALARAKVYGHAQSDPFKLLIKGNTLWFQITVAPKADPNGTHFVMILRDVTKSKEQESEILRLAQFDSLTGLPNRKLFHQRLDIAFGLMERRGGQMALLVVDIDHFKRVNERLGHPAGDTILKTLADRLRTKLRKEDTMSRHGGDEFIMAFPGLDCSAVAHVAERVVNAVARPIPVGDEVCTLSASIGIAMYPEDGRTFEELSISANAALSQIKRIGASGYRFSTIEMQTRMARNLLLEQALRAANDNLELSLVFQPQWTVDTRQVIGMEALLRWTHPTLGDVSAAEFIPTAEASGQILALNDWVLNQALAQIKRWLAEGVSPVPIAVNLSMAEFLRGDLGRHIQKCLTTWNVDPAYLQLELTEAMVMRDPDASATQLEQLHELGVRIVIEDFGTCYSSLLQIKRFHADAIKIDQRLIQRMEEDADSLAVVTSMLDLAHKLGLQTMAQGVETEGQMRLLVRHGCRLVQGFHLALPMDLKAATNLLSDMERFGKGDVTTTPQQGGLELE